MNTYVITVISHDSDWQNPIVFKTASQEKATEFFEDFIVGIIRNGICPSLVTAFGQEPRVNCKKQLFDFINTQPKMEIDNTHCVLYNGDTMTVCATLYDVTDSIEKLDSSNDEPITINQFYEKEQELYEEDARRHVEEIIEQCEDYPANHAYVEKLKNMSDFDYETLAKEFAHHHDCNIPDNDQWENLIWKFAGKY